MTSERVLFYKHLAQTSDFPMALQITKAEGIFLYDEAGIPYYDMISGISVSNLGHNHPKIKEAIIEQVNKHMHVMVYGEFIQSPQVDLAHLLSSLLPKQFDNVYFLNSGTEAVETAIKLAKRYTGRYEIISFKNSYHGSTHGSLSIMGSEQLKNAYRPLLPGVKILEYNNLDDLKQISDKTACVIMEPIQAEAGIRLPNIDFLNEIYKKCNETGTLLIFDEIQTGFGRTGKMFALEHWGIVPDMITLAKSLGGGMPLGALITSKIIMKSLANNPVLGHMTTFGGHPVCCAASIAAIKELIQERIIDAVENKGKLLRELLKHPMIKEVRGIGLFTAIEFEDFETNKKIIDQCLKNKIIVDWFLFADNAMRLCPPLIITETEIKNACQLILKSIDEIYNPLNKKADF